MTKFEIIIKIIMVASCVYIVVLTDDKDSVELVRSVTWHDNIMYTALYTYMPQSCDNIHA